MKTEPYYDRIEKIGKIRKKMRFKLGNGTVNYILIKNALLRREVSLKQAKP